MDEKYGTFDVERTFDVNIQGKSYQASKGIIQDSTGIFGDKTAYEIETESGDIARYGKDSLGEEYTQIGKDNYEYYVSVLDNDKPCHIRTKKEDTKGNTVEIDIVNYCKQIHIIDKDTSIEDYMSFRYDSNKLDEKYPDRIVESYGKTNVERTWTYDESQGKYKYIEVGRVIYKSLEELENNFASRNDGYKITGSQEEKIFNGEEEAIPSWMQDVVKQGEELGKTPHQKWSEQYQKDKNGNRYQSNEKAAQEAADSATKAQTNEKTNEQNREKSKDGQETNENDYDDYYFGSDN